MALLASGDAHWATLVVSVAFRSIGAEHGEGCQSDGSCHVWCWSVLPTAASELDPSLLAKARKLALGVGTAAGAFGSLVGAGGGVLIGPIILNTCP